MGVAVGADNADIIGFGDFLLGDPINVSVEVSEFDSAEDPSEPSDEGDLSRNVGWVDFDGGVEGDTTVTGKSAASSSTGWECMDGTAKLNAME